MKVIFIYGPPAVGKLTVAKELSKLTGYELFHNHLINDLVSVCCDFENNEEGFWKIANKIKREILTIAIKNKRNLILTNCYARGFDDKHIKKLFNLISKDNGKVKFIQLYCDKKELFKRVKSESRKHYRKLKDVKKLKEVVSKWDFFQPVLYKPNLSIDNTNISAKRVAMMIKKHYRL
ncbi:AAA family ATPase [Candidatus Pacearchaeota archaeon]|nr:AAA family ATPase [Candidatus Pacearchaeota archaeon]